MLITVRVGILAVNRINILVRLIFWSSDGHNWFPIQHSADLPDAGWLYVQGPSSRQHGKNPDSDPWNPFSRILPTVLKLFGKLWKCKIAF